MSYTIHIHSTDTASEDPILLVECAVKSGVKADLWIIHAMDTWYSDDYEDAITRAASESPADLFGMQKQHWFHTPTRTWDCKCNRKDATLEMLAFRPAIAPLVLSLCRRGKPDIAPTLWAAGGVTKKLIPNKGEDGRLRCIGFRGDPDDQRPENRPLRRKDQDLKWLAKQMGRDEAERWTAASAGTLSV